MGAREPARCKQKPMSEWHVPPFRQKDRPLERSNMKHRNVACISLVRPAFWRVRVVVLLTLMALSFAAASGCTGSGSADEDVWTTVRQHFASAEIVKVSIHRPGGGPLEFSGAEATALSKALLSGVFDTANSEFEGPTAPITVVLEYGGGETLPVPRWPDGRFEVQWEKKQILVRSTELNGMLRTLGVLPPTTT